MRSRASPRPTPRRSRRRRAVEPWPTPSCTRWPGRPQTSVFRTRRSSPSGSPRSGLAASHAVAARAPAGARALARSVPAWAWLTGLVVVSTLVRYLRARQIVAPWIMVDELIYSELAKSFAATGKLLVRGHSTGGYGPLYPVLISPAYALWDSPVAAYAAVK